MAVAVATEFRTPLAEGSLRSDLLWLGGLALLIISSVWVGMGVSLMFLALMLGKLANVFARVRFPEVSRKTRFRIEIGLLSVAILASNVWDPRISMLVSSLLMLLFFGIITFGPGTRVRLGEDALSIAGLIRRRRVPYREIESVLMGATNKGRTLVELQLKSRNGARTSKKVTVKIAPGDVVSFVPEVNRRIQASKPAS